MNTPLAEVIWLSERATPGEWRVGSIDDDGARVDTDAFEQVAFFWQRAHRYNPSDGAATGPEFGSDSPEANAAFICALVNWFRENSASMRDEGRDALLAECYRWLFGDLSDGPRVSEGAIEKGCYTPEFREFHDRLFAALPHPAPGEGGAE